MSDTGRTKIEKHGTQRKTSPPSLGRIGLGLGVLYWLVRTLLDVCILNLGSFAERFLPDNPYEMAERLIVLVILMAFGRYAQKALDHRQERTIEQQSLDEVAFLSRTAMEFVELPLDKDIYQVIGERLHELLGEAVVIINSFEEEDETLRVRGVLGAGELITMAVRALGRHPVGLTFQVTDEARRGITKGILERAEGGLYQACFGRINKDLCHQIEYLTGVDEIFGVGFARQGGIFGTALIITRKGRPIGNHHVIEAYVNQASVALHRRRAEEELRALSLVDELTGLYNRRGFLTLAAQQLKIANRNQRAMLLLFGDLDRLKWINDTHGHQAGDEAIAEVAGIFRHCFRESDIVARLGGDEFVVLVVEAGDAPPELFTTRIQDNLTARNAAADIPYPLSISIGIERYDSATPCTIQELLDRADSQMYEQKRARKDAHPARS